MELSARFEPLRTDPRPMDGIFHATFVAARMHYAMNRAQRCEAMEPSLRAEAGELLEQDARAFSDGLGVIREHARLSATGEKVLQGAVDYMRGAS